jgi:hypothetical protein
VEEAGLEGCWVSYFVSKWSKMSCLRGGAGADEGADAGASARQQQQQQPQSGVCLVTSWLSCGQENRRTGVFALYLCVR